MHFTSLNIPFVFLCSCYFCSPSECVCMGCSVWQVNNLFVLLTSCSLNRHLWSITFNTKNSEPNEEIIARIRSIAEYTQSICLNVCFVSFYIFSFHFSSFTSSLYIFACICWVVHRFIIAQTSTLIIIIHTTIFTLDSV